MAAIKTHPRSPLTGNDSFNLSINQSISVGYTKHSTSLLRLKIRCSIARSHHWRASYSAREHCRHRRVLWQASCCLLRDRVITNTAQCKESSTCAAASAAAPAPGARICFAASIVMPRLLSASIEAGDSSLSANGGRSFGQSAFAFVISTDRQPIRALECKSS